MKLIISILLIVSLSSCSMLTANLNETIKNTTVSFSGVYTPNKDAERILETAFSSSTVPWKEGRIETIQNARGAIAEIGKYLKTRIDSNNSIPYYLYKACFEIIIYEYNVLQAELDGRVEVEGTISEKDKIIYEFVKRDVNVMIALYRDKLTTTESSMEAKTTQAAIDELKNIYEVIKPLISMVL